jgi:hypothetical protein
VVHAKAGLVEAYQSLVLTATRNAARRGHDADRAFAGVNTPGPRHPCSPIECADHKVLRRLAANEDREHHMVTARAYSVTQPHHCRVPLVFGASNVDLFR